MRKYDVHALRAAKLEDMGLENHVVILLNGKMTSTPKKRATRVIRVENVIEAVEWLCRKNKGCQNCPEV
jgi:hypothetical protein